MKKKTSRTHRWKVQPDDSGVLVKVCYCGEVRQLTYFEAKKLEELNEDVDSKPLGVF